MILEMPPSPVPKDQCEICHAWPQKRGVYPYQEPIGDWFRWHHPRCCFSLAAMAKEMERQP